ncbi:MAG: 50S ribosomal protein L18 [Anaerolineae bacterium]|jgi:large subunit ribosomal protein L18|nr:50S ribosomal protein L18 [Anaerolineae bacterium]MDH7473501.1 50S ribosomal protein L18 [Anaerolineae bacterium]
MMSEKSRLARKRRHQRVRAKVRGTSERPRLNVFRSLTHIYAQIIDDGRGHTLVSASTLDPEVRDKIKGLSKTEQARLVGQVLAQRALARGVRQVVFDRGGYLYHGRVKALADGSREGGLEF